MFIFAYSLTKNRIKMRNTFTILALLIASLVMANNNNVNDDFDDEMAAQTWYADRAEGIVIRFEGLRHDSGQLPQKYCLVSNGQAGPVKFDLVVSTWDERAMILFTPDGDDVKGKVVDSSVLTENTNWYFMSNLLSFCTPSLDITLIQRPLPVTACDKAHNTFVSVVDFGDAPKDITEYKTMIFKPHQNAVRLLKEHHNIKKDEEGNVLHNEMEYTFKLVNPQTVARMFRGYGDDEMVPWVVKNDFFAGHTLLQFSRWKLGEAIMKASPDVSRIISQYYGGRRIKDARWVASVESGERSYYAVQFEIKDGDALAALVCVGEGEVVSTWEFHADTEPRNFEEDESLWFVDDGGNFMEHIPEIQCIVATECGVELYVRVFGGESVQYYVLREVGSVIMQLQADYEILVW